MTLRILSKSDEQYPYECQVEVPASGTQQRMNRMVDDAVQRWADWNDWEIGPVRYSSEVSEDRLRVRVGRFTVQGIRD